MRPLSKGNDMFIDATNAFGTAVFEAPAPASTVYYKTMRLEKKPLRAPKPLSHYVKNFLLNYDK